MRTLLPCCLLLGLALAANADEPNKAMPMKDAQPAPAPMNGEPVPAPKKEAPPAVVPVDEEPVSRRPALEFILTPGMAQAVPQKAGVSFANGGVIHVNKVDDTTIVVTMSGLTATNADLLCTSVANYHFDLNQAFEIRINSKAIKSAKLVMEGRVMGILRTDHSHYTHYLRMCKKGGTADSGPAIAAVTNEAGQVVAVSMPARAAACGDDMSVYDHQGPLVAPVTSGTYSLHQTWSFGTTHPHFYVRGASAEFSPQPEYCPENNFWFQEFKPFNGSATKDFGFVVTLKLVRE